MRKRLVFAALFLCIALSLTCTGCSKKNEVEIGKSYNSQTGELSDKLKEIPANQYVYIVARLNKQLNTGTAGMIMYLRQGNSRKEIRNESFKVHPYDKIIMLPIRIKDPGSYQFKFTVDKKVVVEKTFKVVPSNK